MSLELDESGATESGSEYEVVFTEKEVKLVSLFDNHGDISVQKGESVVFGRGEQAKVRFHNDKGFSKVHCRVYMEGGELWIEDMKSKNGTFVNGTRIQTKTPQKLSVGDTMSFLFRPTPTYSFLYVNQGLPLPVKDARVKRQLEESEVIEKRQKTENTIESTLECSICMSIMIHPVAIVPCLHSFCAQCLHSWFQDNPSCPICRLPIEELSVSRNTALSSVIDTYLESHPEMKPLERIVAKGNECARQLTLNVCPSCLREGDDGYQCTKKEDHLKCVACKRMFPLRRDWDWNYYQCSVCKDVHCDAYWVKDCGCSVPLGEARNFGRLESFEFEDVLQHRWNKYEEELLQEYLESLGEMPGCDVWQEILDGMEGGTLPNPHGWDRNSMACIHCVSAYYQEVLADWRMQWPESRKGKREDCWYGMQCRTQWRSYDHAKRLNHICKATR